MRASCCRRLWAAASLMALACLVDGMQNEGNTTSTVAELPILPANEPIPLSSTVVPGLAARAEASSTASRTETSMRSSSSSSSPEAETSASSSAAKTSSLATARSTASSKAASPTAGAGKAGTQAATAADAPAPAPAAGGAAPAGPPPPGPPPPYHLDPADGGFLGGSPPNTTVDLPLTFVFLFMYIGGAVTHISIYRANSKRQHKFLLSDLMFDFCMVRTVTCIFRIIWVFIHPRGIVLAAELFFNGG